MRMCVCIGNFLSLVQIFWGMEPGPLRSAAQARVVTACNADCMILRHNSMVRLVDGGNRAMRSIRRAPPFHATEFLYRSLVEA